MSKPTVQTQPESLSDYLGLKYPVTLFPELEGGYTAIIPDLPGCMTQGETLEEVVQSIDEARQLWIETAFEFGDSIPLPSSSSGIWVAPANGTF